MFLLYVHVTRNTIYLQIDVRIWVNKIDGRDDDKSNYYEFSSEEDSVGQISFCWMYYVTNPTCKCKEHALETK